jgi:hypothetical protein
MKAVDQVIQPGNVSILRDTGHSPEPTPPAGMADELKVTACCERRLHYGWLPFMATEIEWRFRSIAAAE